MVIDESTGIAYLKKLHRIKMKRFYELEKKFNPGSKKSRKSWLTKYLQIAKYISIPLYSEGILEKQFLLTTLEPDEDNVGCFDTMYSIVNSKKCDADTRKLNINWSTHALVRLLQYTKLLDLENRTNVHYMCQIVRSLVNTKDDIGTYELHLPDIGIVIYKVLKAGESKRKIIIVTIINKDLVTNVKKKRFKQLTKDFETDKQKGIYGVVHKVGNNI